MKLDKLVPVVDKKILILLSGLMWCGVGVMLAGFAVSWLSHFHRKMIYYFAGFLFAMPVHHFGFLKIAGKNLTRLMPLTEKKCFFSFMTWKSYIIVIIMMSLGITLRHSGIPRNYLSVIYLCIGLALFLSGLRYLRIFLRLMIYRA